MRVFISILFCFTVLSCSQQGQAPEIWKSTYLYISNDKGKESIDVYKDHSQYLYLYNNGSASIIDSLANGETTILKTNWEISDSEDLMLFSIGFGKENEGVKGVVYPIIQKDESDFKMHLKLFEGDGEHIWNLQRIDRLP